MADFDKTLDAGDPDEVVLTRLNADGAADVAPLEIVVNGPGDANRLLVFTGIALVDVKFSEDDDIVRRGEVRVRLRYPLPDNVRFISSATTAALSSIFNADSDDEETTFAVDGVATEPQPTDPDNPQSAKELVLTAKLAVQGGDSGISSMAYQANVLVHDARPDVDQVLVRESGLNLGFQSAANVTVGHQWDIEVVLTGPNPGPDPFPYTVSSSDPLQVPVNILDSIQQVPPSFQQASKTMIDPVGNSPGVSATITVTGRTNVRTARITLFVTR
jgi:hypothetical protein